MTIIVLPGIQGSGANHWQTHWEASLANARRFQPSDWDRPDLADWMDALSRAVDEADEPPLLVAHSLACLLVPHWVARAGSPAHKVRGAFLVAVPDPDGSAFPRAEAPDFRDVPPVRFPFPALIVASTDCPYGNSEHTNRRAREWDAAVVVAGALGHINAASGLGDWPQGAALFTAFAAGTARR